MRSDDRNAEEGFRASTSAIMQACSERPAWEVLDRVRLFLPSVRRRIVYLISTLEPYAGGRSAGSSPGCRLDDDASSRRRALHAGGHDAAVRGGSIAAALAHRVRQALKASPSEPR